MHRPPLPSLCLMGLETRHFCHLLHRNNSPTWLILLTHYVLHLHHFPWQSSYSSPASNILKLIYWDLSLQTAQQDLNIKSPLDAISNYMHFPCLKWKLFGHQNKMLMEYSLNKSRKCEFLPNFIDWVCHHLLPSHSGDTGLQKFFRFTHLSHHAIYYAFSIISIVFTSLFFALFRAMSASFAVRPLHGDQASDSLSFDYCSMNYWAMTAPGNSVCFWFIYHGSGCSCCFVSTIAIQTLYWRSIHPSHLVFLMAHNATCCLTFCHWFCIMTIIFIWQRMLLKF